jgi:putative FmdB family regulatory protein
MPLFEYRCQSCHKDFDVLDLPGRDVNRACPDCGSTQVTQKISVFSAHGDAGNAPAAGGGGCGRCGDPQGPCGMG